MGFQVKYEEITSIRELILAQLDRWIEQIDAVRSSIVEIAAMSEMHGEAAEHVRSYMWDYHMNLANMIKDTIETYRSSFILYTDWYYNIDSDQLAEMSQDSMEGLEENIQGARSDFDAVAEEVADIERELSAYLDVGRFSTTCMESCFDNALAGVQNVRTQIGEYEEAHSHADMYPIDMMVGYLRSIIGGQLGGSSATISAYDASVVNATESFQLAQMMDGMLSTYLEQVKDRVNSCEEFYELQQQQWQESIRLRTEEGIVKTLVGVGTMILGGMLVVATCGMALPLVTTVGVVAIGLGTTAYGCANAIEGSQDVYAGVIGDPRMVSVNPIRDTLFASNPDLYYLIGNTLTISASLLLTGGMAANAAVSAGTSIGRAVVTEYAKQGLTVAASSYVEKSMTEATNSPLAGFVVGSLTGMATYGTLSEAELEVVNNVKRPQQLGNVGEGGTYSRLIPGTDGVVTGGNSTKLGKNMLDEMGVPRSTKWTGYQAQHIIPAEMGEHPVLQKIGMDLDDASNGLFLRTPADDISAMSRHRGYHSTYNDFVKMQLDKIDINQSVDALQREVYNLQSQLKVLQQSGLPLYPGQGASIDLWERSLNRIK